jgi:hypothetical protein
MIVHIKESEIHPAPVRQDERYTGDGVSAFETLWATNDGAFQVAFWEFHGEQFAPPTTGVVALVMLSGTLEMHCDDCDSIVAGPGDTIIYDCNESRIFRSPGLRAAYVLRPHDGGELFRASAGK